MANIAKSVELVGKVIGLLLGDGFTSPSEKYPETYLRNK